MPFAFFFQGLLCSRELASVLVSFFPRSVWSTDTPIKNIDDVIQNESIDLMKLQNAIDDFEFHTRFYFVRSEKRFVFYQKSRMKKMFMTFLFDFQSAHQPIV